MGQPELDKLMEEIKAKYDVQTVPFKIGDKILKILQVVNLEEYLVDLIEKKNLGLTELPYWAKVWESSILLAYFLGKQPVILGQRILEIGAGIGLVGIYAASCGHRVTISDVNEDALLFARANAQLNGITGVDFIKLDWNNPGVPELYDIIVGAEVVYDRESYPALVAFLRKALSPGGVIFLAKNAQLNAPAFFAEATKSFEFKRTVQKVKADDESQSIELYAFRQKKNPLGNLQAFPS